jgi:hypothetical protein
VFIQWYPCGLGLGKTLSARFRCRLMTNPAQFLLVFVGNFGGVCIA